MTVILMDEDLERLPAMAIALEAVEAALHARARGGMVSPARHSVSFGEFGSLVFTIGGMAGGMAGGTSVAGFRVYDTFDGPRHAQLTAVWSPETGDLMGIVLGERLGAIRTGAIGGIAIRHMSAPDAGVVGVVGSGVQARTQLQAAVAVRNVRHVRVYSRNEQNRNAFAAEMTSRLDVGVEPVRSTHEAVDGADIVICATTSPTPVIEAGWLKPGVHVTTVGPKTVVRHELGLDVAERADVIATDSLEQVRAYDAPFFLSGSPSGTCMVDLAEIVCGRVPSRRTGDETTVFCSVGLAGTEVLVASSLLAAQ